MKKSEGEDEGSFGREEGGQAVISSPEFFLIFLIEPSQLSFLVEREGEKRGRS